jgi:hypothetical protein
MGTTDEEGSMASERTRAARRPRTANGGAARSTARETPRDAADARPERRSRFYCAMPKVPPRVLPRDINPARARAIISNEDKWVNGTTLHYWFFDNRSKHGENVLLTDGSREWVTWVGAERQREVVRKAFQQWKKLGIGLDFEEVDSADEAEVRIGFMDGDGSWSYIGTYVLKFGPAERTMNFGWDLSGADGPDTALHEIGHTLGLPHEHQNPFAGIVWDEEAVYDALAQPPNEWDRETTHYNIIRKLDPDSVQGSSWDPDSIMHYPFEPHLIKKPKRYQDEGLTPRGGLSDRDKAWIRSFYPPEDDSALPELLPSQSQPLALRNGEQQNFLIRPDATRYYMIRTIGSCDTTVALFADENGKLRYRTADDDSGEDRNASLRVKLIKGRRYVLRVRLKYSDGSSPPAVLMW